MKFERYVDVLIREPAVGIDLHARLLATAHRVIAEGHVLAVAWPDWRGAPGQFGLLFRVFGDQVALSRFGEAISPAVAAGLVRPSPVAEVPEIEPSVRFVRDRRRDRFSPSRQRRRERRTGEAAPEIGTVPNPPPHFLVMVSATTSQRFALAIRRSEWAEDSTGGRQYGLGYLLPDF